MPTQDELFDAVDALLEEVASADALPSPVERRRLREAAGLSQAQVARAVGARREAVGNWELGRSEPRMPQRAAYARLLEGLAQRFPVPPVDAATPSASGSELSASDSGQVAAGVAPGQAAAPEVVVPAAVNPVAEPVPGPAVDVGGQEHGVASGGCEERAGAVSPAGVPAARPVPAASSTAVADDVRFVHGPLGVLDGDGSLYCAGGLVLECPARSVPDLVEWTLAEAGLGAPRLHRSGKDSDPLVVLTAGAAERLGLPPELEDRRGMRLPDGHRVLKQIARAKWQLTRRGFGPWPRVYRPAQGGRRQCVQFAVLPWGALDTRAWGGAAQLPAAELARVLSVYAERVLTPRGSTAVAGLELMTALRPATRAVRDEATDTWVSGVVPGSLVAAVDPAPPEAPDEHPVVAALYARGYQRSAAEVLDEEAFDWVRGVEHLTDVECAAPFAVGIDVNTAFLAAANRLVVGLSGPEHVREPRFDVSVPGSWLVDLSGIDVDPRLPSPFTPHGGRPEGPAWYATPTVAYAKELVEKYGLPVEVRPVEAWVRRASGAYLDPWYKRLSEAYKATMADLGVGSGLSVVDFLVAMAGHREVDPGMALVLSAVKSTVKGGIGKLRERPQGASYRPGERWPALERVTWRPDIRAAVISAARVNMHRKLVRTAVVTGGVLPAEQVEGGWGLRFGAEALTPIALLSDCVVYPGAGPSPLDVLPYGRDGKAAAGTFRLGVSPGMVKHEGTRPLFWAVELLEQGFNPARHIKGDDVSDGGE